MRDRNWKKEIRASSLEREIDIGGYVFRERKIERESRLGVWREREIYGD